MYLLFHNNSLVVSLVSFNREKQNIRPMLYAIIPNAMQGDVQINTGIESCCCGCGHRRKLVKLPPHGLADEVLAGAEALKGSVLDPTGALEGIENVSNAAVDDGVGDGKSVAGSLAGIRVK